MIVGSVEDPVSDARASSFAGDGFAETSAVTKPITKIFAFFIMGHVELENVQKRKRLPLKRLTKIGKRSKRSDENERAMIVDLEKGQIRGESVLLSAAANRRTIRKVVIPLGDTNLEAGVSSTMTRPASKVQFTHWHY